MTVSFKHTTEDISFPPFPICGITVMRAEFLGLFFFSRGIPSGPWREATHPFTHSRIITISARPCRENHSQTLLSRETLRIPGLTSLPFHPSFFFFFKRCRRARIKQTGGPGAARPSNTRRTAPLFRARARLSLRQNSKGLQIQTLWCSVFL